jgi:hypothetical protein
LGAKSFSFFGVQDSLGLRVKEGLERGAADLSFILLAVQEIPDNPSPGIRRFALLPLSLTA